MLWLQLAHTWFKSLQICIDHAPSCIHFCKKQRMQERAWSLYIFPQSQLSGSTGKFIYKALILGFKQLLSNMIDRKATQVPYITRIVFLANNYIFCSNHLAILCVIVIPSYIAMYMKVALLNKNLK